MCKLTIDFPHFSVGPFHSFTQSSFDSPCTPLLGPGNETIGFDSGLTSATQWQLTITNDTFRECSRPSSYLVVYLTIHFPQQSTSSAKDLTSVAKEWLGKLSYIHLSVPRPMLTSV